MQNAMGKTKPRQSRAQRFRRPEERNLSGSVTDSSGALIPGVTTTVLNNDTGISKDFNTNHDGLYDTNSLVPGLVRQG